MSQALNIEIKAKCTDTAKVREILQKENALFTGVDHQIDTYFFTRHGRLKLREGNIENHLIFYDRKEVKGLKKSEVILHKPSDVESLKMILEKSCEVKVVVDKIREIYFIGNVKFHIDKVEGLGEFVEIEAIDKDGTIGKDKLSEQCEFYLELLGIDRQNLISGSYSDMLLNRKKQKDM